MTRNPASLGLDVKVANRVLWELVIPYHDHARVRALAMVYLREVPRSGDEKDDFALAARFAWKSVHEFRESNGFGIRKDDVAA